MSGDYRGILALLATIAVGATSFGLGSYATALNDLQEERYQRYAYPAEKEEDAWAAVANNTRPTEYREPCQQPKGRDESDLCAQWKAARAAERGALWAERGFWVGLLSIFGLGMTILVTLRALARAREANEIARENAMREQRAYVFSDHHTTQQRIETPSGRTIAWWLEFEWVNKGQTPASNVVSHCRVVDFDGDIPDSFDYPVEYDWKPRRTALGPGTGVTVAGVPETWLLDAISMGSRRVYMYAFVEYDDVFEGTPRHRTEACVEVKVRQLPGGQVEIGPEIYGPHNGFDDFCSKPVQT